MALLVLQQEVDERARQPVALVEPAEGAGLGLLGFELQPDRKAAYRERFPEDTEFRDWEAIDAFERGMPWAFSEMYRFWLIKP